MAEWRCPICGFEAHSEEELLEHAKAKHPEKAEEMLKEMSMKKK